MNNSSPGNRFGEGTSGATPLLDLDQPGPSYQNVQDEFFESDSDEEEVFNLNGNYDDGDENDENDENDDNDDGYDTVRGRRDRLVHDLETCQHASNYNRYFLFFIYNSLQISFWNDWSGQLKPYDMNHQKPNCVKNQKWVLVG